MFASFIQAGFECSSHKLKDGTRLDLTASTQHDRFVRSDYERLKSVGIHTAREGVRWHLVEPTRGKYEFSSLLPMIEAANDADIQVIWDLFHFGWPDYLDIFDAGWPDAFADLTFQFASLWKREGGRRACIAPVNEISFLSWGGGDEGFLNPFAKCRGGEVKRQLVSAGVKAANVIRTELPDALIVSPEPVIHIAGDPLRPDDLADAERHRLGMFEAWDMLLGKTHPELGGSSTSIDVLGINYYARNQWWNFGSTIRLGDSGYRPFHLILKEVFERYGVPMFISETGTEDEHRPEWFQYVAEEVRRAVQMGIPVHGICLYPILNHAGWEDNRHCFNGLWDYAGLDGTREIYEPLAMEIQMQEAVRTRATRTTAK